MSNPEPTPVLAESEAYRVNPYRYTHGRCRPCGVVYAWTTGPRRRLKDRPACPTCGHDLTRTCAGLLKSGTVQVREPRWC